MSFKTILVEGLIAAGKSTFCTELGEALGDNTLVQHEHDQESHPDSFHDEFYEDMAQAVREGTENIRRYPALFQVDQLARRFGMQQLAQWWVLNQQGDAVLDRSFYGDTCFARMLAKSGHISEKEFDFYARLYKFMTTAIPHPNVCIRLSISPQFAQERLIRRAEKRGTRMSEADVVGVEYLQALDAEITRMTNILSRMGVFVLDTPWDADRDTAEQRSRTIQGIVDRIRSYEPPDPFLDLHRRTT